MLRLDSIWLPDSQQSYFRILMDVMARPGKCTHISDSCDRKSTLLAIMATLLDREVSLADRHGLLNSEDWLMLQAKSESAANADYILCDASRQPDFSPKAGTLCNPEESATLMLSVAGLGFGGTQLRLDGPGVNENRLLSVHGLDRQWLDMRTTLDCLFPSGIDIFLVAEKTVAALPRTTRVEILKWPM